MPSRFQETRLTLASPAKLNLFLHITGRLGNGYHHLQTLFQLLEFGDSITLTTSKDPAITISPAIANIPKTENIAYQAASMLKKHSQCEFGVKIHIHKKLPIGGGLGGGSSNAATVLLGLNKLWNLNLSMEELAKIGLNLGADVPVFIGGHSAFAEGVGEKLLPLSLAEKWYLVIHPTIFISTATIFAQPQLTRDSQALRIAAFFEGSQNGLPFFNPEASTQVLKNDCQDVVSQHYPEVAKALTWLSAYADQPMLTGTGSCIFASFASQAEAESVLTQLPSQWQGFVSKGVNRSAVHEQLAM